MMKKRSTYNRTTIGSVSSRAFACLVFILAAFSICLAIVASVGALSAQAEDGDEQAGLDLTSGVLQVEAEIGSDVPYAGNQPAGTPMWWGPTGEWGGWIDGNDVVLSVCGPDLKGKVVIPESFQATVITLETGESYTATLSVTTIAGEAFLDNKDITGITLPDSVTKMGIGVFRGCTKLETVEFNGEELASIPKECFKDCSSLKGYTIPASVTAIGTDAFRGCSSLKTVPFQAPAQIYSIGAGAFEECSSLEQIAIPTSVRMILARAFKGCSSLAQVTFDNADLSNLEFINTEAFCGCSALEEIELPFKYPRSSTIIRSSIGDKVFDGCTALTKVGFRNFPYPNGASSIKPFGDCKNLSFVIIEAHDFVDLNGPDLGLPKNATYLLVDKVGSGNKASLEIWKIYTDSTGGKATPNGSVDLVIPAKFITYDFTSINDDAACTRSFLNLLEPQLGLKTVSFEAGSKITRIGSFAFAGCEYLESITIPASVTTIGDQLPGQPDEEYHGHTFYRCPRLTSVTFETTQLTTIEESLFRACPGLKEIRLPDGLKQIKKDAFKACVGLTKVYISDTVTQIDSDAFYEAGSEKNNLEFRMPNSKEKMVLGDYFFGNVTNFGKISFRVTCGSWFEDRVLCSSSGLIEKAVYDAVDITLPEDNPENTTVVIATKASGATYDTKQKSPVFDPSNSERWWHKNMKLDEDFYIDYSKSQCTEVGDAYVTVVGIEPKFTGERRISFTINPADITGKLKFNTLDVPDGGCYWDNMKWTPAATFLYKALISSTDGTGDYALTEDDYTVSYGSNADVGQGAGSIVVKGKGNFTGQDTLYFDIRPRDLETEATFAAIPDQHYTGSALTPEPQVSVKDRNGKDVPLYAGTQNDYVIDGYTSNVNLGTASVSIKANEGSNATVSGRASTTFNIVSLDLSGDDITVEPVEDQLYTGSDIEPELSVSCSDSMLVKDESYTVTWSNNREVGTATAVINGIEPRSTGSKTITFKIVPKPVTVTANNLEKTFGQVDPLLTAQVEGAISGDKIEYSLSRVLGENAGTYKIMASGKANQGNYAVTFVDGEFKIKPADIFDAAVEDISDVVFDGGEHTPSPLVTWQSQSGQLAQPLRVGTDYDVEYGENLHAGSGSVTVKGKGNFTGKKVVSFTIAPLDISGTGCEVVMPYQVYTGDPLEPLPSSVTASGRDGVTLRLVNGADYDISWRDNEGKHLGYAIIVGKGDYCGMREESFSIIDNGDLGAYGLVSDISNQVYTGQAICPDPKVQLEGIDLLMRRGVEYEIFYDDNVNAGHIENGELTRARVYVRGLGEGGVFGQKETSFLITPADIGDAEVKVADQTYDGTALKPKPTVTWHDMTLVEDQDYDITSYADNTNVGTAAVTISGKGNFKGTASGLFNVKHRKLTITANSASQLYDGKPLTDSGFTSEGLAEGDAISSVMIDGSQTDVGGSANVPKNAVVVHGASKTVSGDYDISYKNGYLEVTPYTGQINVAVTGHTTTLVYDGAEHEVSGYDIQIDNDLLHEANIAYEGGTPAKVVDAGVYTMGLSAGNFSNKSHNFTNVSFNVTDGSLAIESADISDSKRFSVDSIPDETYDGKAITPKPVVRDATTGSVLVEGTDYFLDYRNNVDVGKATVIIMGKGNYQGNREVSFQILERVITYTLVSGPTGPVKQGSGSVVELQFKRSYDDETTLNHFLSVEIDGKTLSKSQYSVRKGSAIITLNADYIDSLRSGEHTLIAVFDDGQGTATFSLDAPDPKPTPSPSKGDGVRPATGDNLPGIVIVLVIIALASGGLVFLTRRMWKRG